MNNLTKYIHQFTKLRRSQAKGGAPHKPILLLSVIDLFEKQIYHSNEIRLIPELVSTFKSIWSALVFTEHHANFSLPFYHLSSSNFWNLIPNNGCEVWIASKTSMRSFRNLRTAVKYAKIDPALTQLLKEKSTRDSLKAAILNTYFPKSAGIFEYSLSLFPPEISVYDDPVIYRNTLINLKEQLKDDDFEEEIFIRSGLFAREIRKIYFNTCAISELKVDVLADINMIDACHIIPFADSYNDTISNGIALCPNLHRAFDRGLISISENYTILVSKDFKENSTSNYSISQFESKQIKLPDNPNYYPNLEGLYHHRNRFGF